MFNHLLVVLKDTFIAMLSILMMSSFSWAASPPNNTIDIPWSAGFGGVADIETAFNSGRRTEETQLGLAANTIDDLDLPTQAVWGAMSDDQKALFLINDERKARGGMQAGVLGLPLAGIELNIDNIAQNYTQLLHDNDAFEHALDGIGSFGRIDIDPEIGNTKGCHEFLPRAENLAAFATIGQPILLPVERAIYDWIYADIGSAFGHREAILLQDIALNAQQGYANNNGSADHEGYLGFHHITSADYQPFLPGFVSTLGSIIVMEIFDEVSDAVVASNNCNYTVIVKTPTATEGEVLKRGEMAKAILQKKNIIPPANATGMVFSDDVHIGDLNATWIEKFSTEGFTEGCALNKYCPNMGVTKEQLAKIFLKAFFGSIFAPTPSANVFNDVAIANFNGDSITELRDQGQTQGCTATNFCPKQLVTKEWFDTLLGLL